MRFIGYQVGDKKFGAGARDKAEAESKKTGKPIVLKPYKI